MRSETDKINTIYITHIKQEHKVGSTVILEDTANSQFLVAKEILARPDHIVICEGSGDYSESVKVYWSDEIKDALKIFPNGFPDDYCQLNPLQKEYLVTNSAPITLFFLGLLPAIYGACELNREQRYQNKIESYVTTPLHYIPEVFEPRERQAIYWAKKIALQLNNPNVIIVFGSGHNFEARIKLINDKSIKFVESVNTTPSELDEITAGMIQILHYKSNNQYTSPVKLNYPPDSFDQYYQEATELEDEQALLLTAEQGDDLNFIPLFDEFINKNKNFCLIARPDQRTILHLAALAGKKNIIQYILDSRQATDLLNKQDKEGFTALHLAVLYDQIEIVKLLLEKNINIDIKNTKDKTAYDLAKEHNKIEMLEIFNKNKKHANHSSTFFYQGNPNNTNTLMDALLKKGLKFS